MVDTIVPINTPTPVLPVDVVAVQAAPTVVTETSPSIAPTSVAAPVPSSAPVEANSTVVPTPVVAPETPKEPTLLAAEPTKESATPLPVEEKKTDGGQSVEPAPPPEVAPKEVQFDSFALPEGIQMDNEGMSKFTSILKTLELEGKADHALLQTQGQELVNFHVNELKKQAEGIQKYMETAWEKQRNTWKEEVLADPVLGGNRFQGTIDSALEFIRTHGGTDDEQKEFRSLMDTSGLGNNKIMIRFFANAGKAFKEGQPLAAQTPPATPKSRVHTMYGNSQ